jgi:ABC-2 type transport system permease protein
VQKALFFLPFQYLVYVPAMVWTGSYRLGGMEFPLPIIVGIQAIAVVAMWGLSELLYRLSMRRFNAVGA